MALALGSALRIADLKGNFLKIKVFGIRNRSYSLLCKVLESLGRDCPKPRKVEV